MTKVRKQVPSSYERAMSPALQKVMADKDWFIGAVYWQPGDVDLELLHYELQRMKDIGFNTVRFHNCRPVALGLDDYDFSRFDAWLDTAADVGIRVINHVSGLTPGQALLEDEGLDLECYKHCHGDDPRYRRVVERLYGPVIERYKDHPAMYLWGNFGEPSPGPAELKVRDQGHFSKWLQDKYGTLEALNVNWTLYPDQYVTTLEDWDEAWKVLGGMYSEAEISGVHNAKVNYGAARDFLEFSTELSFSRVRPVRDLIRKIDPVHPLSVGTHQLFANQASLRWDLPRWAKQCDLSKSSIHLSWHFEQVQGETDLPVFLQSRLTRDLDKGGWTSCFETTGGAVMHSGGYGNAMSAGQMRKFCLSYLAAGNQSIAFWTWNARPGGWEAGEYGMTDLAGGITPWATEAGEIGKAMARWRDELWEASDEAEVGVLTSWETDAILSFEPERHDMTGLMDHSRGTKMKAVYARIGAGRALTNAQIPFEYFSTEEMDLGMLSRYSTVYAPHLRSVGPETLDHLEGFVKKGGRLIVDVPFAFTDGYGKLIWTGEDTLIGKLFGAWITTMHDSRTEERSIGEMTVDGFFADLELNGATVLSRFDDGRPAVIEHAYGEGTAMMVACDLGAMCHKPGNLAGEAMLAELVQAGQMKRWQCSAGLAFRRRCETADHYFVVNDGPMQTAYLSVSDASYQAGEDAISGEAISVKKTLAFELPEASGRWIRMERSTSK